MRRDDFLSGLQRWLDDYGVQHFVAVECCDMGRVHEPTGTILQPAPQELWLNLLPTLRVADILREAAGPIDISSGYRDPAYNAAIGGAAAGQHPRFTALDLHVRDWEPLRVAHWLNGHPLAHTFGIGLYSWGVHFDTRGHRARWGTPKEWW